jgi:hypothetical protein
MSQARPSITALEQRRILADIVKIKKIREDGYRLLLAHAKSIIKSRQTLKSEPGWLDNEEYEKILVALQETAENLERNCQPIRPFHVPQEWRCFGEKRIINDGHRNGFKPGSTFIPQDQTTWERIVIEPMQEHHAIVIAAIDELCRRVDSTRANRTPGRPSAYPKSMAYGVKKRQNKPPTSWKDIYEECKRRCNRIESWKNEKLPNIEAYEKAVRRALAKPNLMSDEVSDENDLVQ